MQFGSDRLINPGNTVGQIVMTFLAPQKFFSPVKGEDFRFAGVKEHIQVHPHTKFHGDQRFGRPKFQAPAVGVGC